MSPASFPPPPAAGPPAPRLSWRGRFLRVWAAGLPGIAALLLLPPPAALRDAAPQLAGLPELSVRLLLALNPLVLLTLAAAVGASLAHRAGLRSRLAGDPQARLAPGLALAAGLLLAAVLAAADALLAPALGASWQAFLRAANASAGAGSVLVGLLYGGLAEEVMARWGCMALATVLAARLLRRGGAPVTGEVPALAAWCGIGVAALLFAAGHLPALAQAVEPTAAVVARTLALNAAAGLVYGWLCWRRGLECAMLAHAVTHLGLAAVRWLA
jgi:membrane protease YdiL (CAAX protease family)